MRKTLTLKGFSELNTRENTLEDSVGGIEATAAVMGYSNKEIMRMKPNDYAKVKESFITQAGTFEKPVCIVEYKGKVFGYHPPELETVEDMIAVEVLSKKKAFNSLAAVMFRELKTVSRFLHSRRKNWKKQHGLKVKEITNFPVDYIQYSTKSININDIDLDFWDDFPWQILSSSLSFLMGSGLQFSLSIQPSSLKSKTIRVQARKTLLMFQGALCGLQLHNLLQRQKFLTSTGREAYWNLLQENYWTGSYLKSDKQTATRMREELLSHVRVLGDKNSLDFTNEIIDIQEALAQGKHLSFPNWMIINAMAGLQKTNSKIGFIYG